MHTVTVDDARGGRRVTDAHFAHAHARRGFRLVSTYS
jgi:hypothetical protein